MAKSIEDLLRGRKKADEKEKEEKEEENKRVGLFTQKEKEMLKLNILKVGEKNMLDIEEYQHAEIYFENFISGLETNTLQKYLADVEERADVECVDEMEIFAKDAIFIKKATKNRDEIDVDPSTGRLTIEDEKVAADRYDSDEKEFKDEDSDNASNEGSAEAVNVEEEPSEVEENFEDEDELGLSL